MLIPEMLLRKLYTSNSLKLVDSGLQFSIKNRLIDVVITRYISLSIDGIEIPEGTITFTLEDGQALKPGAISKKNPLPLNLRDVVTVQIDNHSLPLGKHQVAIAFEAEKFGRMAFSVDDAISSEPCESRIKIPRDAKNDYSSEIVTRRQEFMRNFTKVELSHITRYSFNPETTRGNIENFVGVAQIPIGLAGPIKVNGEHAQGEFLVPLATTEGTLVASYNRGIKLMNLSGGVKVTVVGDAMQRAPVFVFDDAREARNFSQWVAKNFDKIQDEAEATSRVAKLTDIDTYLSNRYAFLRFNYTTGDAAGQNMVGRATFAACSWILETYKGVRNFYLESNFATDKKASQINIMRTRGKRVTAEAIIPRDILIQHMRVEPEKLAYHYHVAGIGGFLSGVNNNGLHSANGITAMFIATGQDVANVSESSAAVLSVELTPANDLYLSLTIPSLIVATYGGGTQLATQRECLELLGCLGKGKVNKLAEIIAAVALAGELSLATAISSSDWVSSHEKYGRNRYEKK